jgi:Flagellar filament outer layer protein Flaa
MKKAALITTLALLLPLALGAQDTEGIRADQIGKDQAQQQLVEVSVAKFEDAAFWGDSMPLDMGIATLRRFEGGPAAKKPLEAEKGLGLPDRYVLGGKVVFFKRGANEAFFFPVRPIPIEGLTKTISVWVVGRNYNHVLKAVIADYFNQRREITFGKLNFMGWKQLTAAVPPRIVQDEYHFTNQRGIKLLGFKIEFDMMESYGSYYIYFDDLRATTDLFAETYRDKDDMPDGW